MFSITHHVIYQGSTLHDGGYNTFVFPGMSQSTSPEKSNSSFQTEEDDETMDTTPSPPPSANSNGFSSKPATEKDVKKVNSAE